jgi:nucleoside-diphosphate-sugar epimerase
VGICDGVDAVIHTACAAASTFDSHHRARDLFTAVNRDGSVNLATEVLRHKGLRLVHLSSTAAMGAPQQALVDEDSPCHPTAPYQVSKRDAELALLELRQERGLDVVILRSCLVAGEGKPNSELLKLFRLAGKGWLPYIGNNLTIEKPLLMVDDLVEALVSATTRGRAGEIYLLHSDGHHSMGEILGAVGRLTGARRTHVKIPIVAARAAARGFSWMNRLSPGFRAPLTPERIDLFVADRRINIAKARRELGFEPHHQALDDMLGRTYRWYVAQGLLPNRACATIDHETSSTHFDRPANAPSAVVHEREPLGITYDRLRLEKTFQKLIKQRAIRTALELPAGGAKAMPSLYSLGLARQGVQVTLFDPDERGLAVWDRLQLPYRVVRGSDAAATGIPSGEYDLVWNFVTAGTDPAFPRIVAEMARVSKRYVMTVHTSGLNYGYPWHRFLHWLLRLEWTHGAPAAFFPSAVRGVYRRAALVPVDFGLFDMPFWPDPPGFRDVRLHRAAGAKHAQRPIHWSAPIEQLYQGSAVPPLARLLGHIEELPWPDAFRYPFSHLFYVLGDKTVGDESLRSPQNHGGSA